MNRKINEKLQERLEIIQDEWTFANDMIKKKQQNNVSSRFYALLKIIYKYLVKYINS